MLALVKNFQIQLRDGNSRFVAATRHEPVGLNLIFFCGDRIVLSQPKEEMISFREFELPQSMGQRSKTFVVA